MKIECIYKTGEVVEINAEIITININGGIDFRNSETDTPFGAPYEHELETIVIRNN